MIDFVVNKILPPPPDIIKYPNTRKIKTYSMFNIFIINNCLSNGNLHTPELGTGKSEMENSMGV